MNILFLIGLYIYCTEETERLNKDSIEKFEEEKNEKRQIVLSKKCIDKGFYILLGLFIFLLGGIILACCMIIKDI